MWFHDIGCRPKSTKSPIWRVDPLAAARPPVPVRDMWTAQSGRRVFRFHRETLELVLLRCETQTHTRTGPPSTRAAVAMDGGVADTAHANTPCCDDCTSTCLQCMLVDASIVTSSFLVKSMSWLYMYRRHFNLTGRLRQRLPAASATATCASVRVPWELKPTPAPAQRRSRWCRHPLQTETRAS